MRSGMGCATGKVARRFNGGLRRRIIDWAGQRVGPREYNGQMKHSRDQTHRLNRPRRAACASC